MTKPEVFLTGGDGIGWAVDEDLKLTRRAIESIVDFADLSDCEVVHCVWWEGLAMLSVEQLIGKRIVCHVSGEPFRYFAVPRHRHAIDMVGLWVTRSSQARCEMDSVGIPSRLIPYVIDIETFKHLPSDDQTLESLRKEWAIPSGTYIIGSFQRDTEGSDLRSPKLVKGPDVLAEVLLGLRRRKLHFHVLLAGPRRHWLIGRLKQEEIPFTYVGADVTTDDVRVNSLPRATLNALYNLIDLYIVASRSEGGPHAIMEAAAAKCKVISTPVGIAADILEPGCIFSSPADAVNKIEQDMNENALASTVKGNYQRILSAHLPESIEPLFADLYKAIDSVPVFNPGEGSGRTRPAGQPSTKGSVFASPSKERAVTVGLWHTFFTPPYGGGNQFMIALRKGLQALDVDVCQNELREGIDAYVLNSIHFDVDAFLAFSARHRLNVVHRIDGPIYLIRGFDREKDQLCYDLNARFASATVLQSAWVYQRIVEMGYSPVKPVIIHNAVDSDIFHPRGRIAFDPDRKIRLISTSWSNNPRKGGPVYKWIEKHLDWDRFEYTFVGNASDSFDRVRHIPPVSSVELAEILRNHDVYITASRNDPCSNALIEALACGLPALYLNDGGHPELVAYGGLPFHNEEEILPQLEKLVENYTSFQRLITVPRLDDVAEKYLALVREVIQ